MSIDFWGKAGELNWPKLETGEPEPPALLCETGDRDEFQRVMMLMRGYGIPAIERMPENLPFTTVLFGSEILGGSVYVPESLLDDAKILLTAPPPEELEGEGDNEEEPE